MTPTDAIHTTLHDYPGGSVSLAPRMGMSASTMRAKANPNESVHGFSVQEAVRLMSLTNDYRILHAMAEELGFVCIKLPAVQAGDDEVFDRFLELTSENGRFADLLHKSRVDGVITSGEFQELHGGAQHIHEALVTLVELIRTQVRELPRHPVRGL